MMFLYFLWTAIFPVKWDKHLTDSADRAHEAKSRP